MKLIDTPNQIDLKHHAVIEASAGTGKTYTITHLVRRLLSSGVQMGEILLVTFTDKATSELKSRIHQGILDAMNEVDFAGESYRLYEQALRDLPRASIFTIHGFCQRVLKEFAFEQGAVLDKAVTDDHTVLLKQLHALKRTWPAIDGISEKLQKTGLSMKQLDQLLIDLVLKMQPGDLLRPDTPASTLATAQQRLDAFDTDNLQEIEAEFKQLNGPSVRVLNNRWSDKLMPVIEQLSALKNNPLETAVIARKLPMMQKAVAGIFTNPDYKKYPVLNIQEDAPGYQRFIRSVNQLLFSLESVIKSHDYQFVIAMVTALRKQVKQHKISQGLLSYNDMIEDLATALEAESKLPVQPLTVRLRNKYQVALIDEFQDTDALQWSIFQRLFTAQQSNHRLVLIGDPKQAIYGFRGANIHTYEEAKRCVLSKSLGGIGYRLATNYRSLPELTEQLNQFFTYSGDQQTAWYKHDEAVVKTPDKQERLNNGGPVLLQDDSGLSALNAISTTAEGLRVGGLRQVMAEQIAYIIRNQLLAQVQFKRDSETCTLNAGDICVLVRNKNEAKPIEQALDAQGVAHAFYKKTDLYQTEAAVHIQLILTALAYPRLKKQVHNAWMSLFFNLTAEQLERLHEQQNDVSSAADLQDFFTLWLDLKAAAAQHDWVAVFHLLFEQSGTTERLYLQENWRLLANLRQIKQELLKAAIEQQLDVHGLLNQLLQWRSSKALSVEDWQQKDTELPAVQIMTIHSSKGLEFPVVFLFGGFSAPNRTDLFCKYHDPEKQAQVFDLVDKQHALYRQETEQENKRLYYVAMTRAIYKLFLPVYDDATYRAKTSVFYKQQVVNRLTSANVLSTHHPINQSPKQAELWSTDRSIDQKPPPLAALPTHLQHRQRVIHSFSSLQRNHGEDSTSFGHKLLVDEVQADDVNPHWSAIVDDKPSLPGGAQTGNVLHGIFENLDFSLVLAHSSLDEFQRNQEVIEVINSQMEAFMMSDGEICDDKGVVLSTYRQAFASWVWHTLNKPIDVLHGQRLCEISTANRRHEMSFHWSHDGHVLTGFIDLLFKVDRPDGTDYFILDWKSNFSPNGYQPQVLAEEVMQEHNYHDQYRWYTLAVKTWFEQLQLSNARLAGALYVFSRGMDCESGDQNGVFYQDLSEEPFTVQHLQNSLLLKLAPGVRE